LDESIAATESLFMSIAQPPATAPAFLAAHDWAGAQILPLAADASFRRYFRVHLAGHRAVLMDAPPHLEDSRPFVAVAQHLRRLGLQAPRILAADLALGLLLLEDFGDDRLGPYLQSQGHAEPLLYKQALDSLIRLQQNAPPAQLHYEALPCGGSLPLAAYDEAILTREVDLLHEWFLPAWGINLDAAAQATYQAAWRTSWQSVMTQTAAAPVMVLRDYHADNLMILPERSQLGLLDFQDALAGHAAYDLVSLLQDARRDVSETLEAEMLSYYWNNAPERITAIGAAAFDAAYELLGAQRNTKIIGIFSRLHRRDGKAFYPTLQPRVWSYLNRNLSHPALAPVRQWFDAHIPMPMRTAAPT
jgi:N-acetylmuramate 1-kinase